MSLVHPQDKDIRMAKEYKRRIQGDVGGSWVLRAHPNTPIEKPTLLYPAKGMSGLKTQMKMEIFSPQVSSLQVGSLKVHLNSGIPLDIALCLEKWAAREQFGISCAQLNRES